MTDTIEVTLPSVSYVSAEQTPPAQVTVTEQPVQVIEVSGIAVAGDASLVAHINSTSPHPHYDDLPSLTLLFENGII